MRIRRVPGITVRCNEMYAMVNGFSNVYSNVNQGYMAGQITAPMVVSR